jgi:RNA polymerase sigma factor (sigma-70 family)
MTDRSVPRERRTPCRQDLRGRLCWIAAPQDEPSIQGVPQQLRGLLYFEWSANLLARPLHDVAETKKALIERLFAAHGRALQAFFYRRTRQHTDARDLAQEVYVRMLRVRDPDAIADMEAYLFTVAGNLVREQAARDRRRGIAVDIEDTTVQDELAEPPAFDAQIDVAQQVNRLRAVLRQLPPRWHAAVVMQYVHELSHKEIGDRLGVSPRTVKKYLAQALGRCRRRMVAAGVKR